MQKRSHEPIYKTDAKNEAKRLGATTFAFAKLLTIKRYNIAKKYNMIEP
jgi:hypothetical protein